MRPLRLLIVNPFGIGDVLFTTPLIRAVRQAFPDSVLGYLCNRRTEYLLQNNPQLDHVFIYEKDEVTRFWREDWRKGLRAFGALCADIRRVGFDVVIDLSLGERYGLILKLLGIPRRVGFNYRHRGRFLTASLPIDGYHDEHVIGYYRRLLKFIGVQLQDDRLELRPHREDQRWAQGWLQQQGVSGSRLLVGVVPAGGVSWGIDAPFRRWSCEGFAHVADHLVERYGASILIFGERTDQPICHQVMKAMRHRAIDLSGQTSLGQFVGLLGYLHLIICNDGGPLHLAVSQGVQTVSIFGPVDPRVYGPYAPTQPERHRVVAQEELSCRPCYHGFKLPPCPYERACLTTIQVADVIGACQMVLGRAPIPHPVVNRTNA